MSGNLLSPAEVADLAALNRDLGMPESYQVERDTWVSDGAGGGTTQPAVVGGGPCRLRVAGTSENRAVERLYGERLGTVVPYAIDLPLGTDVRASDRLIVGGQRLVGGVLTPFSRRFEVGGLVEAGSYAVQLTAVCTEQR